MFRTRPFDNLSPELVRKKAGAWDAWVALDRRGGLRHTSASSIDRRGPVPSREDPLVMNVKVRNSLKSLRNRHRDNRLVRRKGRVYIINKTQRRYKARQG